jgi:hypothetical protein
MEDSSEVGIIISINEKNNTAIVEFNEVKFKVELSQLHKTDLPKTKKSSAADYIRFDASTVLIYAANEQKNPFVKLMIFFHKLLWAMLTKLRLSTEKALAPCEKQYRSFCITTHLLNHSAMAIYLKAAMGLRW